MRRWFVGAGISRLSWFGKTEKVRFNGITPMVQLGYDFRKRLGNKAAICSLTYGLSVAYFHSFHDLNGNLATTLNRPDIRFDLLVAGVFCRFQAGAYIRTGR